MASVKHIDSNPYFTFEYTPDVEDVILEILHDELWVKDVLNGSKEFLPSGKVKVEFKVTNPDAAAILSKSLAILRQKIYKFVNINHN